MGFKKKFFLTDSFDQKKSKQLRDSNNGENEKVKNLAYLYPPTPTPTKYEGCVG